MSYLFCKRQNDGEKRVYLSYNVPHRKENQTEYCPGWFHFVPKTLVLHRPRLYLWEGSPTTSGQKVRNAFPLITLFSCLIGGKTTLLHSPSNAISKDVFPEPVGPIIIFKLPRLKLSSPSMFNRNFLRDGVRVPLSSDHT